jgi:hypothetical protein
MSVRIKCSFLLGIATILMSSITSPDWLLLSAVAINLFGFFEGRKS